MWNVMWIEMGEEISKPHPKFPGCELDVWTARATELGGPHARTSSVARNKQERWIGPEFLAEKAQNV